MPSFHCNARYFLITYAQCGDLSEWDVLEHIGGLGAECIIARENHQTLGVHLHVFVDFGRKFRSRKTDVFDVHGRHANIQPSRGTPEKGYDYAIKDGDVVAGGLERPEGRVGSGKNFDLWTQITDAADREEAWSRSWILNLCVAHSASCRNTPIGSTPRLHPCMSHPEDLRLLEEMLTDEIRGYRQLVSDWDNHR